MNDIAKTLRQAPGEYEPLLLENPNGGDPIPILDEWCSGFMKGVHLDSEGWLPVIAGNPQWMSTILLYGTEEGWETLKKKNLSLDQHNALADDLAGAVQKINALWLEQCAALPDVVRREPVRNPHKVGRNELCPCGSGKKFKQYVFRQADDRWARHRSRIVGYTFHAAIRNLKGKPACTCLRISKRLAWKSCIG